MLIPARFLLAAMSAMRSLMRFMIRRTVVEPNSEFFRFCVKDSRRSWSSLSETVPELSGAVVRFRDATRGPLRQGLAAVTVDVAELGHKAARLLDEMRAGQRPLESNERIELPLDLYEGSTLGPAPDTLAGESAK